MRHINKGAEPESLTARRELLNQTPGTACDLYARHLTSAIKIDILQGCLSEQQGLCAYTGLVASEGDAHIEHLVPRSASCPPTPPTGFVPRPNETIDWNNLVACYPHNPSGWPYGAGKKDDWPPDGARQDFVSPLDDTCEERFRYGKQGTVRPSINDDHPAGVTIEKLALDHEFLNLARKEVIAIDLRVDVSERGKLLEALENRSVSQAYEFAFQRSQVLKRLLAPNG